jgi:hypothetical protein
MVVLWQQAPGKLKTGEPDFISVSPQTKYLAAAFDSTKYVKTYRYFLILISQTNISFYNKGLF